jgi:hypothetical protein
MTAPVRVALEAQMSVLPSIRIAPDSTPIEAEEDDSVDDIDAAKEKGRG